MLPNSDFFITGVHSNFIRAEDFCIVVRETCSLPGNGPGIPMRWKKEVLMARRRRRKRIVQTVNLNDLIQQWEDASREWCSLRSSEHLSAGGGAIHRMREARKRLVDSVIVPLTGLLATAFSLSPRSAFFAQVTLNEVEEVLENARMLSDEWLVEVNELCVCAGLDRLERTVKQLGSEWWPFAKQYGPQTSAGRKKVAQMSRHDLRKVRARIESEFRGPWTKIRNQLLPRDDKASLIRRIDAWISKADSLDAWLTRAR